MPDEIQGALSRATGSLPPVTWLAPEELRTRANRWRRRRTVVTVFAAVLVLAAGFGVTRTLLQPGRAPVGSTAVCPPGLVPVNLRLPPPGEINVSVFNATNRDNLARSVGTQLTNRGLHVVQTGNYSGELDQADVTVLRFGPAAYGAAWVLRSYVHDEVHSDFDINRPGDTVDLVLGNGFRELASPTEVNRLIARLGPPQPPPNTCPTP